MGRVVAFVYGVVAYAIFMAWVLYTMGFLANAVVPKTIDSGVAGPMGEAVIVNLLLIVLFAVQHTVMARQGFKRWWTQIIPQPVERSTYVMASNIVMWLLIWQWRPIPDVVWSVPSVTWARVITGVYLAGWAIFVTSSFMINHFALLGVQQVYLYLRGRSEQPSAFRLVGFYKYIRHPLMLGFLLVFWATPQMSVGHLLFAGAMTTYILMGTAFEERDLLRHFGQTYRDYRNRVPMLLPLPKREQGDRGLA